MNARTFAYGLVWRAAYFYYGIKYWVLRDYIARVDTQAYQLYKESQLFNLRWQEMGLEFAEGSYKQNRFFFVDKVRKGPLPIRLRLWWDFFTGSPYNAYYLTEK